MARWQSWQFVVVLLAVAGAVIFVELGRMDVESANEGQRAAPPQEMLRSGDFLVPTLNGRPYLAKPPLLYWAIAGVYAATGVISERTARIPTAVCGIALTLCAYLIFRRKAGELPARWAALALLASPYVMERSRWAELDIPLLLMTFLAITATHAAWRSNTLPRRAAFAAGGGLALAAASMLKGPAPYVFMVAAFFAYCLVASDSPDAALRRACKWSAPVFLLGIVLWFLPVSFPVALTLMCLAWLYLAWRHGGPVFWRALPVFIAVLLLGLGLALPWALAVLYRHGFEATYALLQEEILNRTHTATEINSGSPFYYLAALPILLAPWGLLLPLHLSKQAWRENAPLYRFSLVTGWLSLALLSLIAGKEYEYLLPAVPFLLLPTGYHLAGLTDGKCEGWVSAWLHIWQRLCGILLPITAAGLVIGAAITAPYPALLVETVLILAIVLGLTFWRGGTGAPDRFLRVGLASALVICSGLLVTRSFHYLGARSPRELATLCGRLLQSGYTVEATKVYPAFAFYAKQPIPENVDQDAIKAHFLGKDPYFYVTREAFLPMFGDMASLGARVVAGPCTPKDLVLVGNTSLGNEPLPQAN